MRARPGVKGRGEGPGEGRTTALHLALAGVGTPPRVAGTLAP